MRAFTLTAAEDPQMVFDTVFVDEENGGIAFDTGAGEQVFDALADADELPDLDIDEVIERLLDFAEHDLRFVELPADQAASLTGAALKHFNDLHHRGHGGLFAHDSAPSAGTVKQAAKGDSGGIEEVAPRKGRTRTPKVVFNELQRARAAVAREEGKSRERGDRLQSEKEMAARAKVNQLDREMRLLGHSPVTGESYNPPAPKTPRAPAQRRARGSLDRAIETGQPDALADYKRPALLAAAKKRNLLIPAGTSDDDLRKMLISGGSQTPAAVKSMPDLADELIKAPKSQLGEQQVRDSIANLKLAELREVRAAIAAKGVPIRTSGKTKKQLQDDIAEATVTNVRDDQAIRDMAKSVTRVSDNGPGSGPAQPHIRDVQRRARDLGIDMSDLHSKQEILDRIAEVEANRPKTHTSKVNAHSIDVGDRIIDDGQELRVVGHRSDLQGGKQVVILTAVDKDGRQKKLVRGMNEPINRVVGGRTSRGSFALEAIELANAAFDAFGLSEAERIIFNKKHPRGVGGLFGHKTATVPAKLVKPGDRVITGNGEQVRVIDAQPQMHSGKRMVSLDVMDRKGQRRRMTVGADDPITGISTRERPRSGEPVTRDVGVRQLNVGDHILDPEGEELRVKNVEPSNRNGKMMMIVHVVGRNGRPRRIIVPPDHSFPGLVGVKQFASWYDPDAREFRSSGYLADTFGLEGDDLLDFNRKHPRGMGGKFGHSVGLFGLLKAKAAKAGDTDGTDNTMYFNGAGSDIPDGQFYARQFDWSHRDRDVTRQGGQEHLLDITGPSLVDQEEDEDGNTVDEYEEKTARLHMSDGDMRNLANIIGTGLLREQLNQNPLDAQDPRTAYMVAMMDLQPQIWKPDDPTYDESFMLHPVGDGTWRLLAIDDDGDEVNFTMSGDEVEALYGQLASYLLTPPGMETTTPEQQAAAEFQAEQLDYAEAFAQWAATEFDISLMPERLQRYWTEGEGALKVRWGTRGSFRRCRRALVKEGVPLRMVNGACANLYKRATGKHPGPHGRRNRTGPGRAFDMGTRIALPTQTACASCGNDQMTVDIGDEPMPDLEAPSTSTGWRGPLAPIDIATGDRRRFAEGALASRQLPLPFRWQEEQRPGHEGAIVVGALTGYSILDEPYTMPNGMTLDPGTIMGEGYFLDPAVIPQAERARYLVEHGLIGPSVDLEPNMDVAFRDEAGNTFDPHECQMDGTCPAKPEALITNATIAGATLVPITAFAEARAPELFARTVGDDMAVMGLAKPSCGCGDQMAAVRANGWDDLPFADRDREWDKGGVNGRLVKWATGDDGELDLSQYGRAFLWHDEPADTQGAFKLPIADVIDGELTIVPRGVFAVANRLGQTDIPASAKQDVRGVLEDLYDQMSDEFDDEEMHAPWDNTSHEMAALPAEGCGCADKWARSLGAQTAASVFEGTEPYPAEVFKLKADKLTPMTIEERPGEGFARIYGHIASWSSCNRGYRNSCVHAPRSRTGYANFHLGQVRTTEGMLPAGKIVMGEGHPDTGHGVKVARAFYDATSKQIAWGRMHDDEHGAFFSGVLAPGVSAQEAATFLMSPPSGDWKDFELMAVLAVNVPGHVVPRATLDTTGQPGNMVAAGRWLPDHDDGEELDEIAAQFTAIEWEDESARLAAVFK